MPTNAQFDQEINRIADALATSEKYLTQRIPEALFVKTFLPFFAGHATGDPNTMTKWIAVAGSPFAAVDVMNERGEVLYRVPALFDMESLGDNDRSHNTIKNIIITMNQFSAIHPNQGLAYFRNQMNKLGLVKDRKEEAQKQEGAWAAIFARYNVTPVPFSEVPTAPTAAVETKVDNSDMHYDDDIL